MPHPSQPTVQLQLCITRAAAGDAAARIDLLRVASEQLKRLTRRMLSDFPGVRRWEETDDVLQNSLLRLWRALDQVTPITVADFVRLAATQIRRELIDLARHYFGPEGVGANHASDAELSASTVGGRLARDPEDGSQDPRRLARWTQFHEEVQRLPDEERDLFDLVWYQGLSHQKAAHVLDVSERTIQRRWQRARLRLHRAMGAGPSSRWE